MSAHQEPLLSLQDVTMTYRTGRTWEPRHPAITNLSISVNRGEILGLIGPSGCGKTTTLRVILGLETVDSGTVRVGELDITQVPAERRKIGIVFQNYALFTELNAFGNIAFGLQNQGIPAGEILRRVDTLLTMVQLPQEVKARLPHQLSAGEQQRVAIARALAIEPEILLMDEPFANLDAGLRRHTSQEIRALVQRLNIATILVTHDQSEAFGLCDRIGVMCMGKLVQTAAPTVVYERPSEPWVAKFLGFQLRTAQRLTGSGAMSVFRIEEGSWDLIVRDPSQIDVRSEDTFA
jgi:ABC-type Fe3+/spermidine/putrescine transport system ATPase subunit